MSESTHRKGHHHLKQFLVMIVLHATIIIENHRCSLISCIRFPLGQTFSIGIPRTGKVQPRTAHLVRQHLCRLSASGHRSMAHDIVEHKRNLHTMRAAEYSVHHGRFPSKHIHIDRCTLLCRLQFGLLHCAGAENEVHIHQVLGLITGVGLLKSFQKIIRTFTIFLF